MNVSDAIRSRRSIRKFEKKTVENEKIGLLLESVRWAPSAGNRQPWDVIVVDDREKLEKIADSSLNQQWIAKAPLVFVLSINQKLCGLRYGKRGEELYCIQSTSAAAQNLMLQATELGLGSCWIDPYNDKEISKILECPDHSKPICMIAVGYPDERVSSPAPERHQIQEFSYYNTHGNVNKDIWKGFREYTKRARKGLVESLKKY